LESYELKDKQPTMYMLVLVCGVPFLLIEWWPKQLESSTDVWTKFWLLHIASKPNALFKSIWWISDAVWTKHVHYFCKSVISL